MTTEAVVKSMGPSSPPIPRSRVLVGVALSALFLMKLGTAWFFHKYDWDILEVVFLPLVHGQTVVSDPYSFLLSGVIGTLGQWTGGLAGFYLLMVTSNLLYIGSGVLIYLIARNRTGSAAAAVLAATIFLSSYSIVYVSSYLDDNVFQAFFVALALWLLLDDRPRFLPAAVCFGLSCAFHLQSLALAPAFAVGVWLLAAGDSATRIRKVASCAAVVALIYASLLLLFVDLGELLAVIGGAASHGPGAFVVSQDNAGLGELLARGMVATLLPFPVHVRAVFDHPTVYLLVLGSGLFCILAIIALAAIGLATRRSSEKRPAPWLVVSLTGVGTGVLFALLAEPDGTERWVSVAPFFALCAAAAATQVPALRRLLDRPAGLRIAYSVAALALLVSVFPGKLLAFAAFGGERQVVTSGMIGELQASLAQTDLIVLDEGFEALSLYRRERTCYTTFEYWRDTIKCWGPEGVSHRERTDSGYLHGQRTIAMQHGLPDLDAGQIVQGEPVEICDPNLLARAFGRARCVTLEVGTVR